MKKIYKIIVLCICAILPFSPTVQGALGDTTRVSVASDGSEGYGQSISPSLSADGRYVVFESGASNLVTGDINGRADIFLHDRNSGNTTCVSIGSYGAVANKSSTAPEISANGRYITFESKASNLISDDINGVSDIFVHDLRTGSTKRVSVDSDGTEARANSIAPTISGNGRYVAFESDASNMVSGDSNGASDIFIHDRYSGRTMRISVDSSAVQANGDSYNAALSVDGRYVAFQSNASNLVSNDTNRKTDIFVYDMNKGSTTRVSIASNGAQGNAASAYPAISEDGRYVAFWSAADNLVEGDTNNAADIFVHDLQTGSTIRVSINSDGLQANGDSYYTPSLSGDGRYVSFYSDASNLVPGDTNSTGDIFVHDLQTGSTIRVSVASNGEQANARSYFFPGLSADGAYVSFCSEASNLVTGDTNGVSDVFIHELDFTAPEIVFGDASVPASNDVVLLAAPSVLTVQFSQNMLSDGSPHAANSVRNYMLLGPGANGSFDTEATSAAICAASHTPDGDDERINFNAIAYSTADTSAILSIDSANVPLKNGQYRLYVCGEQSMRNSRSIPFGDGTNIAIDFRVDVKPLTTGHYEQGDSKIVFNGTWETAFSGEASGRTFAYTNDSSARVEFSFTGSNAILHRNVAPDRGDVEVWVDRSLYGIMRNYVPDQMGFAGYPIMGLEDGTHSVELVFSSGYYMDLDAIVVCDPVTSAAGQLDDADLRIAFNGSWDVENTGGAANSTMHYSSKEDATITLSFNGTGVDITRFVGADRGDVDVYIDGEYLSTYSSYSESAAFQQVTSITGLDAGDHTLELRNASPGTYMSIDAIEVTD